MGPRSRSAVEKAWAADIQFQLYAKEEMRKQGATLLHIMTELRRLAGLIESGLGQTNGAIEAIQQDYETLKELVHERRRPLP
jgi:hypothetical protein